MGMKKRNLAITGAALAAVATLSIGGTFAYLSDMTETKTNTFSSEKTITGDLEEPNYREDIASRYLPGQVITKDPQIVIGNTSSPAFVALRVECVNQAGENISLADFENTYGTLQVKDGEDYSAGIQTSWKPVSIQSGDKKESFYIYVNGDGSLKTVAPGETTDPLFDAVQVNAGIKSVIKTVEEGKKYYRLVNGVYEEVASTSAINQFAEDFFVDKNGSMVPANGTLPKFQINVTGYAVQSENIAQEDAITALADLAGVTLAK